MREIKFRVWDRKYKTFDYNASPDVFISTEGALYEKDERVFGMQSYLEYNKSEDYELSQYTGLKDKNGKEIYEGDIVTGKREGSWHGGYDKVRATVYFSNVTLRYAVEGLGGGNLSDIEDIEVIGNIYSNPELMEQ